MSSASVAKVHIWRVKPDSDLLEELNSLANREGIFLAQISGIGALSSATLGIFLPREARYDVIKLEGELEICHLSGNISLKEDKSFVHAHLVVSDREGRAWGGHLLPGCRVFVAEVIIISLEGARLKRFSQPNLPGLFLWPLEVES
ncbi:MAG: PPC domain-containing DNA-binding protein [Candidatus Aminicenantales bacterium]